VNLRTRLLLLGCCFLLFQLGILYFLFENSLDPKINKLEQGLVERNLTRSMEVLQRELFHIEHTTQLMSSLPLIKESVTTLSLSENKSDELVGIMGQQELNLVYILDNNNKVIWGNIIDLNTLQPYPNPPFLPSLWKEKPGFLKPSSQQSVQAGIFTSFLGPILIVSSPILSSDPKKAIAGTLIIGKLITHEVIQLIQTLAFTDMKLWPLEGATLSKKHQAILKQLSQTESNFLVEKNESAFQGYISLSDLSETASLLISASQNRDFSQTIKTNLIEIGACLIALQLIFMALLSWSIRRRLIVPMKALINELQDHAYDNQTIDLNKHTWKDLTPLVESLSQFKGLIHTQAASQNTLAYRQGIYFAREELSDDLQKMVEPLISNLVWVEQKLFSLPTEDLEWLIAQCRSGGLEQNQIQDLAERLQSLSDKMQAFQKETRAKMIELHTHSLHHAAHLRARANSLMPGLG
jgi:sensor domain CHASE-containing protein